MYSTSFLYFFALILILSQHLLVSADTSNNVGNLANKTDLNVYNLTKLLKETINSLEQTIEALRSTDSFCI
jgi:hypothetical protein